MDITVSAFTTTFNFLIDLISPDSFLTDDLPSINAVKNFAGYSGIIETDSVVYKIIEDLAGGGTRSSGEVNTIKLLITIFAIVKYVHVTIPGLGMVRYVSHSSAFYRIAAFVLGAGSITLSTTRIITALLGKNEDLGITTEVKKKLAMINFGLGLSSYIFGGLLAPYHIYRKSGGSIPLYVAKIIPFSWLAPGGIHDNWRDASFISMLFGIGNLICTMEEATGSYTFEVNY